MTRAAAAALVAALAAGCGGEESAGYAGSTAAGGTTPAKELDVDCGPRPARTHAAADVAEALRARGFAVRIGRPARCAAVVSNVDLGGPPPPTRGGLLWCAVAEGTRTSHSFFAFSKDEPELRAVTVERDNVECALYLAADEQDRVKALRSALRSLG